MIKVLDLFCAGGGAGMGLHRAWPKAEIHGVDINRQPNYPFNFVQGDALTVPLEGYDFIWASPPCQLFTRKSANWGRKRNHWIQHPDLIDPIRQRLLANKAPFVIENVVGAPIRVDLMLCGSMFGLKIRKHRNFESSFPLRAPSATCNHDNLYNPWQGKARSADKLRAAMGIDWLPISGGASRRAGYTGDLFNAIPPAYSEFIARQCPFTRQDTTQPQVQSNSVKWGVEQAYADHLKRKQQERKALLSRGFPSGATRDWFERKLHEFDKG